jgi:hypothetical protein
LNPALTSKRTVWRFRRELMPVVEAGRHQFFRGPTADERTALATGDEVPLHDYTNLLKLRRPLLATSLKGALTT